MKHTFVYATALVLLLASACLPRCCSAASIYVASPLGFSIETKGYLAQVKSNLVSQGWVVIDPWEVKYPELSVALKIDSSRDREAALKKVAHAIGKHNADDIRRADAVLAIVDGAELDSGTVSELAFAAGMKKPAYGLRTDFRDSGDFQGIPFNLQVLYFLESSGGKLFRSIGDMNIPLPKMQSLPNSTK